LGAEDQFGQYDVHAVDIDLKNKVIGGFKDRVKSLVDQYGGDYAAASKQLVKEIVNTKNDKFFKLAAIRNKYAEEQRRMKQQLGPNAIVMKDVLAKDLMDADGNYINPEDLQTEVLSREQFKEMANREYGYLAKDVQEGKFGQSEVAGLLKRQIRTGINSQQVPEVANNIYGLLKKQRPDLPDDVAKSIAMEEARSYVGDVKYDYQGDPGYTKPTVSDRSDKPDYSGSNPYTTALGQGNTDANNKLTSELKELKEAADLYFSPDKNKNSAGTGTAAYSASYGAPVNKNKNSFNPVSVIDNRYKKALAPFKDDGTFIELTTKRGMGPLEAASYVTKERVSKYMRHDRYDTPVDGDIGSLVINDIRKKTGDVTGAIDLDKRKPIDSDDFKSDLIKGTEPIVEFNNAKRTTKITLNVDGKLKHYELPMDNIQNNAINIASKKFSGFVDNVYGSAGEQANPVTLDYGNQKFSYKSVWNKNTKSYDKVLAYMQYNPDTKQNETVFYSNSKDLINSGEAIPLDYGLDKLADFGATAVTDTYGRLLKYKERKR
jgi:hypothetical protein